MFRSIFIFFTFWSQFFLFYQLLSFPRNSLLQGLSLVNPLVIHHMSQYTTSYSDITQYSDMVQVEQRLGEGLSTLIWNYTSTDRDLKSYQLFSSHFIVDSYETCGQLGSLDLSHRSCSKPGFPILHLRKLFVFLLTLESEFSELCSNILRSVWIWCFNSYASYPSEIYFICLLECL